MGRQLRGSVGLPDHKRDKYFAIISVDHIKIKDKFLSESAAASVVATAIKAAGVTIPSTYQRSFLAMRKQMYNHNVLLTVASPRAEYLIICDLRIVWTCTEKGVLILEAGVHRSGSEHSWGRSFPTDLLRERAPGQHDSPRNARWKVSMRFPEFGIGK